MASFSSKTAAQHCRHPHEFALQDQQYLPRKAETLYSQVLQLKYILEKGKKTTKTPSFSAHLPEILKTTKR